jgi:lipopolysaccharide/colanic/teichoic acid biosynthesis glycosyltransferase
VLKKSHTKSLDKVEEFENLSYTMNITRYQFVFKYIFDRVVALIGLLLLCPVLMIVAIMIKIKMPSVCILCAERVGKDGKLFNCHKFRSMTVNIMEVLYQ